MPFIIDTVQALATRARNAFRSELQGADAWVSPNNVNVSAKVFAGVAWALFGALARIDKNRFIMSADPESVTRYGAEYGLSQNGKTYAAGSIDVVCTSPFVVPAGTTFYYDSGNTSLAYATTVSVSTPSYPVPLASTITVPVVCSTAGKTGNLIAGTPVTTALTGVTSATVNALAIGGGTDGESNDDFRLRVLGRRRQVPAGGSAGDYVAWAKEVSGVTRAWCEGNAYGPGTVGLWFLMDDTYAYGIPTPTDVTNVQAYINARAPVTAKPIVAAPVAVNVDVVVRGLTPNSASVQSAASLEVLSVFRRMVGVSVPSAPTTLYMSWLWRAVSNAAGEQHHTILTPSADQTYSTGQLPVLRSISYA